MKLSVITVCKNAARTIERTLRSVAEQTYRDIEYIVLDGASDDGTQAIVERHRHVVGRFESKPDGGIYPAMNQGVRAATGDYLYFLNADDYLADPKVLADVAGFLKTHPDCDFVYGDIDVVHRGGRVSHVAQPPPAEALEYLILGCLPHQGSFARAELFRTIGTFDEAYRIAADYDWFLRLLQNASVRIHHYSRRIAYYSEGGMSSSRTADSAKEMFHIQDRAPVYQTDYWRRQRLRKYQEAIGWYRELFAHGNQHELVEELREARRTIRFMEGTRAWKLRQVYVGLRGSLATLRRSVLPFSFPRSAWECSAAAPRPFAVSPEERRNDLEKPRALRQGLKDEVGARDAAEGRRAAAKHSHAERGNEEGVSTDHLPIHFLTIVLNGEPFLRYHIDVFRRLPFPWHWHVVEGVAELKHDTAWSVAGGGHIASGCHRAGKSIDGTTEYLDRIQAQYPDQVTLYRKPDGVCWDGKTAMVNAPLANIRKECLLWQVDADELWTAEQLTTARQLFLQHPEKTAASYWCRYFVGERLLVSTRQCYSQNPRAEWLRTWRFRPGMSWSSHEPPRLADRGGGVGHVGALNPFTHAETEAAGLVFQHFAYVTPEQLRFKEQYYGYRDALAGWAELQQQTEFPRLLRRHFAWVKDHTEVDLATNLGVVPLARQADGDWRFDAAVGLNGQAIHVARLTRQLAQLQQAQADLQAIQTTPFWKLYRAWNECKRLVRPAVRTWRSWSARFLPLLRSRFSW